METLVTEPKTDDGVATTYGPNGPVDDLEAIDVQAERRLVRKIDLHVVPMVMLLYLTSFLDRYDSKSHSNFFFQVLSYIYNEKESITILQPKSSQTH
jgi:hypothetical protein